MRRVKLLSIVTIACLALVVLFITSDQNSKQPDVTQPIITPNFNVTILAFSGPEMAHGNGVIVNSSGIIQTAYHIVEKSSIFQVKVGNQDYMAELIPGGSYKEDDGALAQIKHSIDNTVFPKQMFQSVEGINFDAVEIYDGPKEALYNQEVTIQGYKSDGILRKVEGLVMNYDWLQRIGATTKEINKVYDYENLAIFVYLPADSIVN